METMKMRKMLGAEIRGEIAAQDLKIGYIEERSGVERTSIWRYLKGDRAMPLDALVAIAETLGVGASELIQRAEQRARRETKVVSETD